MSQKAPKTRKRFRSVLDELSYLNERLMYWLYRRSQPGRARPFAARMQRLLPKARGLKRSLVGSGYYALVAEAFGRWDDVAKYTKLEIQFMDRLRRMKEGRPLVGIGFLASTLGNLGYALIEIGDGKGALRALRRSQRLCRTHGLPYALAWLDDEAKQLVAQRQRWKAQQPK